MPQTRPMPPARTAITQHTFPRAWLDDSARRHALHKLELTPLEPIFIDETTRTLDHARAVILESQRIGIAGRIALIALIPSILLGGIIGAISILN